MSEQYNEMITSDGYIKEIDAWSEDFAEWRLADMGLEKTDDRWKIVLFMRRYYEENAIAPSSRVSQKYAKKEYNIDSKSFYALFPNGPKQAAMAAGLGKPSGC
jgi:TusE/DsrC/DsvC family sulfur relay protein